jgi:DNA-directed RNA polymerase subunit H (RpoH/RPB5)
MISQYIGNRTTIYTLSTGKEIVLKEDELKELLESNEVTKELLSQIKNLEYYVRDAEEECSELIDRVHDLEMEINELGKKENQDDGSVT